jgi:CubicO group peptidase (beta-lactamase class C family)
MKTIARYAAIVLFFAVFTLPLFAQSAPPPDLDAWVARSMQTFEVPGMAVAIVKDGKIVLTKGYGVKKLGAPDKVDENSLFGIGSNTKAFTTAALSMLVDEKKIAWDDPVQKYLPWFQLYDPYVTRELMIRDLLTHRSGLGLGAGDLMYFPHSTFTRDEILRRMRYIKPATSFRSRYAYDNALYMAAGQIIPAVTGQSWDDFVRDRIFKPLGMNSSSTTIKGLINGPDVALPHTTIDGTLTPITPGERDDIDNVAPAGSINSSVADMAKWVQLQLNHGQIPGGARLFSPAQSRTMWTGQTILPIGANPPASLAKLQATFAEYALGWSTRDYLGHKLVGHTGGVLGYVTRVMLVPDQQLGVVILTNAEEGGAFDSVLFHILDHYLQQQPTDWITAYKQVRDKDVEDAKAVEAKAGASRAANVGPSLPAGKYAGDYTDPWYGPVTIREESGKLVLSFDHSPSMVGELEHWQYDTFKTHWRDRTIPDAYVTFALKSDGSIDHFTMLPVSPLADFSYDYQDLWLTPVKK